MSFRCRILKVSPKDKFEYKYSLLGEDNRIYAMDVERREHIYVIEREGEIIGREIEWNEEGKTFRFLD